MPKVITLKVNGLEKKSTEINYEDLIWLYKDFERKYGRLPLTSEGKGKYNLPQQRIIKKILEENNITYNDFMLQFGKVSHVRADVKNYNSYITRFKEISNKLGRPLLSAELINNPYGLPSATWFVKNCPNKEVKTYDDFVIWLGCESHKQKRDKEEIAKKLIELEKELNRPITRNDITLQKTGFSMIVINRIWGTLENCKKELNLLKTLPNQPKPFIYYKNELDNILTYIKSNTERDFISWKDIENSKANTNHIEHKTFTKAFKRENIDIFVYIKSKGFMMNPSNFSFHYTFDDGERVVSAMEYDFSDFLKKQGYLYKLDYQRDIMYKNYFIEEKTRMNCDYVLNVNGKNIFIEIAGIIHNANNNWEFLTYSSKQEQGYQEKMKKKKKLLEDNQADYLFLFPEDFIDNKYIDIFNNFMSTKIKEIV